MVTGIKKRDAYYCNLKFLLLFLVVFGHWIEPYIGSFPLVNAVYHIIYTVHMPLFIFLSGTFLTSGQQAKIQTIRLLFYYLTFQTIAVSVETLFGSSGFLYRPYWHLWYLLSLSLWSLLAWILEKWGQLSGKSPSIKVLVILLAIGVGCGAGCLPWIGRTMSLSRTLVFFPYVLAGLLCPRDIFRGKRIFGVVSLIGFAGLYLLFSSYIPTCFLYHADSYRPLEQTLGIRLRLICYLMGGFFGIGILALMPEQLLWFSKVGTDTLGIYLCHAPLVALFRLLPLSYMEMVLIGPAASLWIINLLYQMLRWRSQLYAVYIRQRRHRVNEA